MAILITNEKVSLDRLADRLLTKRATDAQRGAAVRALRAANPGLTGAVAKGTPVVLPELPHMRAKLDVGTLVGSGRLETVEHMLASLPDSAAERAARVQARSKGVAAGIRKAHAAVTDADVKRFVTPNRTTDAANRAKEKAKEAAALAKAFSDAAPRWSEELARLKALLLRTG